jgi:glycosyltransferase involved in cell wall biosynthesis
MKVIHISLGKANPDRMNGVSKAIFELLTHLHQSGARVAFWGLTPSPDGTVSERVFETRLFKQHSFWPFAGKDLEAAIQWADKETVFHVHGAFSPWISRILHMLVKYDKPFVHTGHGAFNIPAVERSGIRKKTWLYLVDRPYLEKASGLHCLGQSEHQGIVQLQIPNEQVFLIPNGFTQPEHQSPKTFSAEPVFLFIGRITIREKGLDILLQGFRKYLNEGGTGKLHMAGGGPDEAAMEQLIQEYALDAHIVRHGAVYGAQKDALIAQASCFIHTSRNEGIPMAVLEVCSNGCPVILSRETNLGKEVSQYHAGIVLEQNTPEQLALAMHQMKDPQALATMSTNCWNMVQQEFSWKVLVPKYLRMYEQILNSKSAV